MGIRVPRKPSDAYQHGNLRHALVQAGLRLLSEGGVHNLSLRGAAQLAGVSHAAPYRHFADKDALVAAIAEEGFVRFAARLREATERCPSPRTADRLREMAVAYVAFAREHPAYLRVMFGGVIDKENAPESLRSAGHAAYAVLRDLVAAGITAGELRAGDADRTALACWSLTHGFSMLLIEQTLPPVFALDGAADEMTRTLVGFLQEGIAERDRGAC